MMTEHTPGPWRVVIDDTGGPLSGWPSIEAPDDLDMAIIHTHGFHHEFWDAHPGLPETLANARLIAAAPETAAERDRLREINAQLADALEACLSWMAGAEHEGHPRSYPDLLDQADAALRAAGRMREGDNA